jgi:hypothetical protein
LIRWWIRSAPKLTTCRSGGIMPIRGATSKNAYVQRWISMFTCLSTMMGLGSVSCSPVPLPFLSASRAAVADQTQQLGRLPRVLDIGAGCGMITLLAARCACRIRTRVLLHANVTNLTSRNVKHNQAAANT